MAEAKINKSGLVVLKMTKAEARRALVVMDGTVDAMNILNGNVFPSPKSVLIEQGPVMAALRGVL